MPQSSRSEVAMDTGMAGAITAVAGTITVGAEDAATTMVGGTTIIAIRVDA
jgi:hypothetical protein